MACVHGGRGIGYALPFTLGYGLGKHTLGGYALCLCMQRPIVKPSTVRCPLPGCIEIGWGGHPTQEVCPHMSDSKCPICGQRFRPSAGHCTGGIQGGCCSSFAAGSDFDAHRVGTHDDGQRRCLTHEERFSAGWEVDTPLPPPSDSVPTAYWISPHTLRSRARMAERADSLRGASPVIP